MSVLTVPELDAKPWPSLGGAVVDFIRANLVFGPGALRGQPAVVDPETEGLIYRMYEVFHKGHALEGQRRFSRVGLSLRKGVAKTEKAAWIAICEMHPDAPVRTVRWSGKDPEGAGVDDPYVPVVAFSEKQSEELVYGAMLAILQDDACPLSQDFDLGLERIMRRDGHGKAVALSAAPSSRDGARTTFEVFDETHHMTSDRLKRAHQAMLANLPKRKDAWALEVTTAYAPGQNSVAEGTMDYARAVADGRIKDAKLFFFHRQASDHHDLKTVRGLRAAVKEASGPAAKWSNIETIVDQWKDPSQDKTYLERVWLNRVVQSSAQAFDSQRWVKLAKPRTVPAGSLVVIGFAGARYDDAAAVIGTEIETGYQWVLGAWEQPVGAKDWEVPEAELDAVVSAAFEQWKVWRLYANPFSWETTVADWSGRYSGEGDEKRRVVSVRANQWVPLARIMRAYDNAQASGELSHDGNAIFARHIGSAHRRPIMAKDDEGHPLWIIQKERADSPQPIDAAKAGALSWEARRDALAMGATNEPKRTNIYNDKEARPDGFLSV